MDEPLTIAEAEEVVKFYLHLAGAGFHESPVARMGLGRAGWTTAPLHWRCTVGAKLARCPIRAPLPFVGLSILEAYWLASAAEDVLVNEDLPELEHRIKRVEQWVEALEAAAKRGRPTGDNIHAGRSILGAMRAEELELNRRLSEVKVRIAGCWKARDERGRLYDQGMRWLVDRLNQCSKTDPSFLAFMWPRGRG